MMSDYYKHPINQEIAESLSNEQTGFPIHCLPDEISQYVQELAVATQTPVGMSATFSLGVLSTVFQQRFDVQVNPSWLEPLNLFIIVIAPPGSRKNIVLNAMVKPFLDYEADCKTGEKGESLLRVAHKRQIDSEIKSLDKSVARFEEKELTAIGNMRPYRLITGNSSPRVLIKLMEQHGGIASVDSNGGFLNKRSIAGLDIYLQSYSGEPIIIDQISAPKTHLRNPRLTIMHAGLQSHLTRLLDPDDMMLSLCACYLITIFNNDIRHRSIQEFWVQEKTQCLYDDFLRSKLLVNTRGVLTLSSSAMEQLEHYCDQLNMHLHEKDARLTAWDLQLTSRIIRVAGLLHCAAHFDPSKAMVGAETIENAITIVEYLRQHAATAFELYKINRLKQDIKYLVNKLRELAIQEISMHDLHLRTRGHMVSVDRLKQTIQALVDLGIAKTEKIQTKGRPGEKIYIDPAQLNSYEHK